MIETDFLKHLDRLSLIINKRITSDYAGERITENVGRGLVFKDYVIYSPGDDFRSIDWRVFGRLNKLFTKRYEEERNLVVHVIIDYSGSMNFASGKTKKGEYAGMLALGFCYMAMRNNERFVLSTFSEKLEPFPPRKGKKQLVAILDYLNKKQPSGKSRFEESLTNYKKLVNTKSFVVIISDFLYPIEEISRVVGRFRQHELRLVQVLDPVEAELPLEGDFRLRDIESSEQMRTFISPFLRKHYLAGLNDHQARIKKICDEVKGRFFTFTTNVKIFDAFYQILQDTHGGHLG
ncbi:DUF58 domain-containing protein [Candidatus Woesearchaeota archaeon]|nr:DUF58 domain-containing protein [Candidatus Woesearchaeota archaeon]